LENMAYGRSCGDYDDAFYHIQSRLANDKPDPTEVSKIQIERVE